MPIEELIISSFALQNLKPLFFQKGEELPVNGAEFPKQQSGKNPSPFSIKRNQTSLLGTPVFSDMLLKNGVDEIYIDAALFEVSKQKNIVVTKVTGRNTSVKEYINSDDYSITVRGVLHTFKTGNYPEGDMNALISILESNIALDIICPFLRMFGIFNIVITDYNFPQRAGFENTQQFTFNALSDEPIQLLEGV